MILRALFYVLFGLPLAFQIFFGIKVIIGHATIKLWLVSLISCVGQILITIINAYLMALFITQAESHDGLPMVGVVAVNMVLGILLLFVILIQFIVRYWLTRRNNTTTK